MELRRCIPQQRKKVRYLLYRITSIKHVFFSLFKFHCLHSLYFNFYMLQNALIQTSMYLNNTFIGFQHKFCLFIKVAIAIATTTLWLDRHTMTWKNIAYTVYIPINVIKTSYVTYPNKVAY